MTPTELNVLRIRISQLPNGPNLLYELDKLGLHLNAPLISWLTRVLEASASTKARVPS